MIADMSIRAARTDDAPELAKLVTELGYPSSFADVRRRLPVLLESRDDLALVMADADDKPIGWLHAVLRRDLQQDARVEIVALVIDSRFRSAGHGRALVERAEQWAVSIGARRIRVRSNVTRERTHAFYLRAGYALGKTSHVFERELGQST